MAHQRYRKRKRKTFGRFILKILLICCMCLAIVMGATIFFKVEMILVEGNAHYTEEEIISATDIQLGENLFSIQKTDISKKITYILPYVQSIEVKLHLPTGIKLVVQEQVGMVELITDSGIWYMGVQGKLLENTSVKTEISLPEEVFDEDPTLLEGTALETPEQTETEQEETNTNSDATEPPPPSEDLDESGNLSVSTPEDALNQLYSDIIPSSEEYNLEYDPTEQPIISVSGLNPVEPQAGALIEVAEEDQRQLDALLSLFKELEELNLFDSVTTIHVDKFNYLEFNYAERFTVKLPFTGDYNYKLRALLAAIEDRESYETGMMDLTQEHYAVLFTPD